MNVGVVVSRQGPQAGGGFTYDDEIIRALCRRHRETEHRLFLIGYGREIPAHLAESGLPYITLHRPKAERRREKIAHVRDAMRRWLKLPPAPKTPDYRRYPDLARRPVDLMCYLTPQIRPVADIPYLTNVWDLEHRNKPFFPEVSLGGEWQARETRYREVLSRATYILTTNTRGKEEVIRSYGVEEERVRTFSLPTPSFALEAGAVTPEPASLAHLGIAGDFLFFPAQFWPHKNHACLLLALKILREKYDYRPQLVLTGSDKGNRAHVEALARELGVQGQIVFPGFVSREELIALYRQATALVFPTFFGPENLPPLEAFALGCPVIASRVPGHDEQLGSAALLVDPLRPDLWAEEIERLRRDPALRQACIARGRERALRFTPDHFVRDLFGLMDEFAAYRRCWPAASPS